MSPTSTQPQAAKVRKKPNATINVIKGQKLLVLGIICNFLSLPLLLLPGAFIGGTPAAPEPTIAWTVLVIMACLAIFSSSLIASLGVFTMGKPLFPGWVRYVLTIGVLVPVPFVSLVVMLVANTKANAFLRARNITIGLLGAKR